MPDYIHIGKIVAPFGVKGEIILKHVLGVKTQLKNIEVVFVEENKGSYLPYFVQSAKAKDLEETYVKLESIDARESAARICSKNLWLLESDFRKLAGKNAAISLIGYTILDREAGNLGPVEEVIEQPHQVLLKISLDGKEALIPLHAETLLSIDHKKTEIRVTLPDGLLDIYR